MSQPPGPSGSPGTRSEGEAFARGWGSAAGASSPARPLHGHPVGTRAEIRRREARAIRSTGFWVLAVVCCVLAGALFAQDVPPVAAPAPAAAKPPAAVQPPIAVQPAAAGQPEPFWTPEQEQTYNEVKAILDQGGAPTSRQRRALEDVCDQIAAKLKDAAQVGNWGEIRDRLIGVDTYAVSAVMKHELAPNAPEQVRLQGIIVLVSVKDTVQPKDGIVKALKDPSPGVRLWALRGVMQKQYADAGAAVVALLLDDNSEVCLAATAVVQALKVPRAEGHLVSMVQREVLRRAPLTQQLTDLQAQLKTLQDKVGRSPEDEQQLTLLSQRIEETSGRIAFSNLLIYRVGEALVTLTNGADGSELTKALSDADLQKVIEGLQQKYGSSAAAR